MNIIKMDEKTRVALLGVLPFSSDAVGEFTPEIFDNVPSEYSPVFKMRPLKTIEKQEVERLSISISSETIKVRDNIHNVVRKTLISWEKLFDLATGDEIEYKEDEKGFCDVGTFNKLTTTLKNYLNEYSFKISGISSVDKRSLDF